MLLPHTTWTENLVAASPSLDEIDRTDGRDGFAPGHSRRVAVLAGRLARRISDQTPNEGFVAQASLAGLLHDVGKRRVPRAILCKPGALTQEETAVIQRHSRDGHEMLSGVHGLAPVLPGVLHHHERYDGTGYPDRLAADDIPLIARIVALADSFDAMVSTRPYKRALSLLEAIREIRMGAGTQFDPALVEQFIRLDLRMERTMALPAYLQHRYAA